MNAKIYTGNVQPNPKEYKVWVNDEGVIKTWNGTKWIEQSGEQGGTASKYAPRYFKIDWNKASEDWKYVLTLTDIDDAASVNSLLLTIGASYKRSIHLDSGDSSVITSYPFRDIQSDQNYGFSYIPLYVAKEIQEAFGIAAEGGTKTFEDMVIFLSNLIPVILGQQVNLSMEGITEITENEYYKN